MSSIEKAEKKYIYIIKIFYDSVEYYNDEIFKKNIICK